MGCNAPRFENQVRRVWSVKFNECLCQNYDMNEVKNIDELIPCEIFYGVPKVENSVFCDDLVGFQAKAWATSITPKAREIRRWAQDSCK